MPITPLTVYSVPVASTTLTTAEKLISVGGGAAGLNTNTKIGTALGWGEIVPLGTTAAWASAGSMPAQSGKGLLFDATTLEGQEIVNGNWSSALNLTIDTPLANVTADVAVRFSVRSSGGIYTTIGTITITAQTVGAGNLVSNVYAGPATSFLPSTYNAGDKLYIDAFLNITADNISVTSATNVVWHTSASTSAGAPASAITTPGYIPQPANLIWTTVDSTPATDVGPGLQSSPIDLLLGSDNVAYTASYSTTEAITAVESLLVTDSYTSSDSGPVADATTITQLKALTLYPLISQPTATLATASSLASVTGGTLGAVATTIGTASGFGELYPEGTAQVWAAGAAIEAPTGHGWLYDTATLEGAQFFADFWQPSLSLTLSNGGTSITADVYFRVYKRSSTGVFTLINSFVALAQAIGVTATAIAFTPARLAMQTLAAGDKIYTDCMLKITTASLLNTAVININASNVAGKGTTDWETFTPGYTVTAPSVTNNLWTTIDSFPATDIGPGLQSWGVEMGLGSDSLLVVATGMFTETASATDVGPGLQSWGIDSGNTSDSFIAQSSYNPTDMGQASDTLTVQSLYSSTEALLPIDATTYTDTYNATDAQSVLDSISYSGNPLWVDLATASDSLLVAESYIPTDATSAIDISSLQSWLVEFGLGSDSVTYNAVFVPVDTLLASDPLLTMLSSSFTDAGLAGDLSSLQSWLVDIGIGSDSLFVVGAFVPLDLILGSDSLLVNEVYSTIDSVLPDDSMGIFVSMVPVYSTITVQTARGTITVRASSGAITVQGARGTITARVAKGTITVQGARENITMKGI